jgi:hypothetical protein
MCSTGCFAKYGSAQLDSLISCTVEQNDCVHVPGKESAADWTPDRLADLPAVPLSAFDIASLQGGWYKIMGLDSRYDCFDCQYNSFQKTGAGTLAMEAQFRIPRPTPPGYLQSNIQEVLHLPPAALVPKVPSAVRMTSVRPTVQTAEAVAATVTARNIEVSIAAQPVRAASPHGKQSESVAVPHLQSQGHMFGLTFWENWYILGQTSSAAPYQVILPQPARTADTATTEDMKLVYYTGHTLQGSYRGAFVYARSPKMTPSSVAAAKRLITFAGLAPERFCMIRNACFTQPPVAADSIIAASAEAATKNNLQPRPPRAKHYVGYDTPFWFLGQSFFRATTAVAAELADWFQDPAILSEWLVRQQVRMVVEQPLVRT